MAAPTISSRAILLCLVAAGPALGMQGSTLVSSGEQKRDAVLDAAPELSEGVPAYNPTDVEEDGRVDVLFLYAAKPGTAQQKADRLSRLERGVNSAVADFHAAVAAGVPGLQPALRLNRVGLIEMASVPEGLYALSRNAVIAARRDAERADLVVAIHASPKVGKVDTRGVAYPYCRSPATHRSQAYSLVQEADITRVGNRDFTDIFTAAHELGHLFGGGHDMEGGQPSNCMHSDTSYGHSMVLLEDGRMSHYGTLMAYRGARQRIFSNPDASFRGVPAGTRHANNARAIRESYRTIANYFPARDARLRPNSGPVLGTVTGPASAPRNSIMHVELAASDPDGVGGAELIWRGSYNMSCPALHDPGRPPRGQINATTGYTCTRTGDAFRWSIFVDRTGSANYTVRAFDTFGTYTAAPRRTVRVTP